MTAPHSARQVLVLGAQGYIGRAVSRALAAEPALAPRTAGRRADAQIMLDATDAHALARAVADTDAVVNCVAGSPDTIVRNAQALKHALQQHPRPLVHFSSMAAYGGVRGTIDEQHALKGDLGPYSAAKAQAEHILADLPGRMVLRPGCVYGLGSPQWSERIARLLRAHRIGDMGSAGDGCSNLVHVDDVTRAVIACLLRPEAANGAYNLAMRDAPDWNTYFLAYAKALGAVPLSRIGARRLKLETKLAAPALKILEIAAGKARLRGLTLPPPIPPSLARLWQQDIRLDSRAAEDRLGLAWTPLAEGLRRSMPPDLTRTPAS
ncbi:capsular polysaccharide biosynthesis protein [Bordetella ansorpii]|uniref:Capsular polysaccharide biosynthesis protein n=1 Tax=Bordetella ansorpii TaxID=288768 RepID=A0A157S8P5_9BORD|nr:NAD-dependent epimerase/dehydratase family protein [Bordetella ansorpii]SAI66792.1 capsular polysaccharide biosynthesis protein [Bordetella ansorpii]